MTWTAGKSQGFVLAATVAGDRTTTSSNYRLADPPRRLVDAVRADLASLPTPERRARVAEYASRLAVASAPTNAARLPPRARALLAAVVDHPDRVRWLADAPSPRPGYRVDAGLRWVLREIACACP